jgi:hypothetical protein
MKFKSVAHRKAVMASMKNRFAFGPVWQHEFDIPVDASTMIAAGSGQAFLPSVSQYILRPSIGMGFSQKSGIEPSRGLDALGDRITNAMIGLFPDKVKEEEEVVYVVSV